MIANPTKDQLRDFALAILAHINGEPVEAHYKDESNWYLVECPNWNSREVLFRPAPAPAPKMRDWNCVEDVPVQCWMRLRNKPGLGHALVCILVCSGVGLARIEGVLRISWDDLSAYEHSTDLVHWQPCTVPEP